eukprot:TRINITY_DN1709_c0_g1_i3.p1 TRINITY_DN1709_c0_g1~~TRINITY_DN1709_c0_g1_i3.p1  ORF type:complete len:215 (+),score=9.12 TRINITY_DN1709_c0_g1_i3:163-807(+)
MPLWRVATAPDELDSATTPDGTVPASFPFDSNYNQTVTGFRQEKSGKQNKVRNRVSSNPRSPLKTYDPSGPFLVKAETPSDLNKNTEWFLYPGVWTMYFLTVALTWLLILSVLRCSMGTAWTLVHLIHATVTFYLFHWKKGSPVSEDQGVYDKLTWWEQMDDGRQLTRNRKFLTLVPVILYVAFCSCFKAPCRPHQCLFALIRCFAHVFVFEGT